MKEPPKTTHLLRCPKNHDLHVPSKVRSGHDFSGRLASGQFLEVPAGSQFQIVSDAFKNLSTNLKMRLKSSPQSFILTGEIQPRDLRYITGRLASQFKDELQDTLVISQQDGKHSNDLVHLLSELEDEPFLTLLNRSIFAKEPLEDQNTLFKLVKQHLFQSEQKFDQLFFTLDSLPGLKVHQETLQKLMRCLIKQFDRIIITVEPRVLGDIRGFFPFIHGSLLVTPVNSSHKQVAKSIRHVHRRAPVLGLIFFGHNFS